MINPKSNIVQTLQDEYEKLSQFLIFDFVSACFPPCLSQTRQLFWLNFVNMMYNLIKQHNSGWKMTPYAAKLVSNKPCLYHDIFFATWTRFLWKSQCFSVLSVLICRSPLCFLARGDLGTSWLAHRALTRLCQQRSVCKPHHRSAQAETDQFTPLQLKLQLFRLSSNWT